MSLEDVVRYVDRDAGFAARHYNEAYLDRRISARMRRTDSASYEEYLGVLREDPEERSALVDALNINVTGFFRNPDVWERLRSVLRTLAARERRVRVWSAPCADGREPYSVAMLALADGEIDAGRVSITASDIDEEALAVARRGVYEDTPTTDLDEELAALEGYERFIEREDGAVRVTDEVQSLVRFDRHDLIRDDPRRAFDLVLSRNFLIYVDADRQSAVIDTLVGSLAPDGYFLLGKTESLPRAYRDRFDPVEKRLRLYRHTPGEA